MLGAMILGAYWPSSQNTGEGILQNEIRLFLKK